MLLDSAPYSGKDEAATPSQVYQWAVELLRGSPTSLLENAAAIGAYLHDKLKTLGGKYPCVREVRGLGLLLGLELGLEGKEIVNGCQEKGLLINCVNNNVLRFIPPLTVTRGDVDRALAILEQVLVEKIGQCPN
ncbi:MAG: Acetylornithine aminotransferase [Firmicutes bacterium ADurb.Bin456]|nr:MAG: Acetylornithine aminotransferase [Firmicutes bacterium ADurb.Bin456]